MALLPNNLVDQLVLPVQETNEPHIPIQEHGPENLLCTVRLYDSSVSPWRFGNYVLRFMPKTSADKITEAMAQLPAHPKGFTNNLDDKTLEQKYYSFDVEIKDELQVKIQMLDDIPKCNIQFQSETTLKRSHIISQPDSRLPNACASVEFLLTAVNCKKTCESRFRITVESDIDEHSRDYNIMFTRKPKASNE